MNEPSRFLKVWIEFLHEESGQATTEYILILAVIMGFLVSIIKKLIQPIFSRMASAMTQRIQNQFFGANLHKFRVP